jgi:hypothetical protein
VISGALLGYGITKLFLLYFSLSLEGRGVVVEKIVY